MLDFEKSHILESLKHIKHGFFNSKGGVSKGIFSSLNGAYNKGDNDKNVFENRELIKKTLGVEKLVTVLQEHTKKVTIIDDNTKDGEISVSSDALVTDKKNIAIAVKTADCVPVLFADKNKKIIGASHSGWKGAFSGVLEKTIDKMVGLGAKKEDIVCAIGPAISQDSYEVDANFKERFVKDNPKNDEFFIDSNKKEHYLFDLKSYVISRLAKKQIKDIETLDIDTYQNKDYFSFRRNTHQNFKEYGCQLSVILIK